MVKVMYFVNIDEINEFHLCTSKCNCVNYMFVASSLYSCTAGESHSSVLAWEAIFQIW